MDQLIYDSCVTTDYIEIQAPYYNAIRPTKILFKNENISAFVDSLGHIEFFDENNQSLGFVDVAAAESPDMYGHSGQYGTVWCKAEGDVIRFRLPIYGWNDSYPHCDGESDRWDRYTVRHFHVVFHCKPREIIVLDL